MSITLPNITAVLIALWGLVSTFVALTPSTRDDEVISKLRWILELLSFFQPKTSPGVLSIPGKPAAAVEHEEIKPLLSTRNTRPIAAILELPAGLIDRRAFAAQAHGPKREWKVYTRPWEKTTGICLHQTACVLGERVERWDTVGAHLGITRSGKIVWLHSLDTVVAAANGWNAQTISIEVDGLFAGVEGDPKTVWDDPTTPIREVEMLPTADQLAALTDAIRWINSEIAHYGGRLHALVAHRQSSADRKNDPGSAIWKGVAIPMMAELALTDGGPGFRLDDGSPIPESWDASRIGIRY